MKPRVDWDAKETRQYEGFLRQEFERTPDDTMGNIASRAMLHMPADRRRAVHSKVVKESGALLRDGVPMTPSNKGPSNRKRVVGDDAKAPSAPIITRPNGATEPAPTPAPRSLDATTAPATAQFATQVDTFLDTVEDKAVDLLVNVLDRVLRHPAVVGALHALVRSAFEKDAEQAVDKTTAAWPERGPSARLPRVLIAGVTPKDTTLREQLTQQYSLSLALRFWDEQSQSKGQLKQMLHGSADVIVLTERVSHASFQIIKARTRKPPIYVSGADLTTQVVDQLERMAKQSVINETTGAIA